MGDGRDATGGGTTRTGATVRRRGRKAVTSVRAPGTSGSIGWTRRAGKRHAPGNRAEQRGADPRDAIEGLERAEGTAPFAVRDDSGREGGPDPWQLLETRRGRAIDVDRGGGGRVRAGRSALARAGLVTGVRGTGAPSGWWWGVGEPAGVPVGGCRGGAMRRQRAPPGHGRLDRLPLRDEVERVGGCAGERLHVTREGPLRAVCAPHACAADGDAECEEAEIGTDGHVAPWWWRTGPS